MSHLGNVFWTEAAAGSPSVGSHLHDFKQRRAKSLENVGGWAQASYLKEEEGDDSKR